MVSEFSKASHEPLGTQKRERGVELDEAKRWKKIAEFKIIPAMNDTEELMLDIVEKVDVIKKDGGQVTDELVEVWMREIKNSFDLKMTDIQQEIEKSFSPIITVAFLLWLHEAKKIFSRFVNYLNNPFEQVWQMQKEKKKFLFTQYSVKGFASELGTRGEARYVDKARRGTEGNPQDMFNREVQRVLQKLSHQAAKKIKADIHISNELGHAVLPHELLLEYLVRELTQNAVDAMGENGGIITIDMRKSRMGDRDYLEISIQNSGPTIPQDQLLEVVKKGVTTKAHGTGLGLFLTKQAVENVMKGTFQITSEEGVGTTCTMRIPIPKVKE